MPKSIAKTVAALARATRRSESSVRRWLKRGDWPLGRKPPWNIAAVKKWAAGLAASKPTKRGARATSRRRTGAGAPKVARTTAALADATGRAEVTVRRWLKRPDWPFGGKPPWNIQAVVAWAASLAADNAAGRHPDAAAAGRPDPTDRAAADLRLRIERGKKIRLERLILAGKHHDVATCRARRLAQIHAVKSALLDLGRVCAPELLNVADLVKVEQIISRHVRRILDDFAGGDSAPSESEENA